MMRIQDEAEFLQAVCKIVVNDCGHAMVWIGYAEEDEARTVRPVAYAGFEKGYLETLKITWSDTERGRGPTGTAIRTGKPSACSNMLTDPAFEPWRAEALKRGYASSIVLPLMSNGKALGAITIYSKDPGPFSADEVKLLAELADDLSFGVAASRLRVAHAAAEEALRRSEERFHSLFNAMTEGFALHEIICDEEGNPCDYTFLDLNPAFERLTGLKRDQLISKTMRQVLPDDDPLWIEAYGRVALTGEPVHFENYSPALNRHYEVFAYSPAPRQFAVVFSEITDRKRAEEALRESEERYRQLVQFAPTGIYEVDFRTGRFTSVNDAMCQILGYSRDELLALTAFDILDDEGRASFAARIIRGQAGEKLDDAVEYKVRRKDGRIIWGLLNSTFHWEGGRIVGATVVANDITERKQMEQALRSSNDNLERVVAERTAELQAANTRLRALTRDIVSTQEEERRRVSRELHDEAGQALTALKLSLQSIQSDLPVDSGTYRQQLGEAVTLTDTTLEQIRMLAQDLRPPALEAAGLNATLEGLCREFAHRTQIQVSYSGVQLSGLAGPASICIYRFLQEALTNAARHGHATRIQVCLEKGVEEATLSVQDNGQGFDPNRVLASRDAPKSMGLIGMQERLMIVHGQLEILSRPGQGARLIAHVSMEQP
jgi:PAS domain S-box-containing protein